MIKRLMALVAVIIVGMMHHAPTEAQDFGYDTYSYQANSLCVMRVTVSADTVSQPITAILQWGERVMQSGELGRNDSIDLLIQEDASWYLVIVQREEADKGRYTVSSGLMCGDDAPGVTPDTPISHMDKAALKQRLDENIGPIIEMLHALFR